MRQSLGAARRRRRRRGDSSAASQARRSAMSAAESTVPKPREVRDKVIVGVNFGSSAFSAAVLRLGDEEPQRITFGQIHQGQGGLAVAAFKLPTLVEFSEGTFRTLGHEPVTDLKTTSSGAKQSLDENLCKPGSEGAVFVELCKKNSISKEAVITRLFADALPYVEIGVRKALGKNDEDTLASTNWMVTVGVPVIWTFDERGRDIQKQLTQCMVDAGYPVGDGIRCDEESGLTYEYLRRRGGISSGRASDTRGQELYADVGASTMDLAIRMLWYDNTLLANEPVGCGGGMADFWRWLHGKCRHQFHFKAAETFVHSLKPDTTQDFLYDGQILKVSVIKSQLCEVFKTGIGLILNAILQRPNIKKVTVSGEAPTSNAFIQAMFESKIQGALTEAGKPKCPVIFIASEDASLAVCMGAAIPYDEDPRSRFWHGCFGLRLHMCSQGKCTSERLCKGERSYIAEIKARKSWQLANWIPLSPDDMKGDVLTIEPCMVEVGVPWRRKYLMGTAQRAWGAEYAVGMNPITVILPKNSGPKMGMRFRWDEKLSPNLEGDFSLHNPYRLVFEVGEEREETDEMQVIASCTRCLRLDRDSLYLEQEEQEEGDGFTNIGQSTLPVEGSDDESQHGPSCRHLESPETPAPTPPPLPTTAPPLTSPLHGNRSPANTAKRVHSQFNGANSPNKKRRQSASPSSGPAVTASSDGQDTQHETRQSSSSQQVPGRVTETWMKKVLGRPTDPRF